MRRGREAWFQQKKRETERESETHTRKIYTHPSIHPSIQPLKKMHTTKLKAYTYLSPDGDANRDDGQRGAGVHHVGLNNLRGGLKIEWDDGSFV
jgi:hypothetical protein